MTGSVPTCWLVWVSPVRSLQLLGLAAQFSPVLLGQSALKGGFKAAW
jgi:hypothetical protein